MDLWGIDPREERKEGEKEWVYHGWKTEGCEWLKERQKAISAAPTVLVVGGGALGVRECLWCYA